MAQGLVDRKALAAFTAGAICPGRALAEELGMRPLIAHCHLGLGKLYQQTTLGKRASEHLTAATTIHRELDMPFWLQKAEIVLR